MQKVQKVIFLKRVHGDKTYLRTTKDMQDQEKNFGQQIHL